MIAGQVEDDESFADAAVRELAEEARLDAPLETVADPEPYEIDDEYRPYYAPGVTSVTVQTFAAEAPSGWEPTLNHEHDEYRWVTLDEALALLHWDETKRALRRFAESRAKT